MNTIKSKLKKEILDKISIMENNTFLFPKSWSDKIDMINEDWSYRTYHSGSTGGSRYHNLEIYTEGEKFLDIGFRGNSIRIEQDLDNKQIGFEDILFYVSAIFKELHSFKNHNEGKRVIRKKISEKMEAKKRIIKEIVDLKQQIIDFKLLDQEGFNEA